MVAMKSEKADRIFGAMWKGIPSRNVKQLLKF